jgi:hypothetical protein
VMNMRGESGEGRRVIRADISGSADDAQRIHRKICGECGAYSPHPSSASVTPVEGSERKSPLLRKI